MLLNDVIGDMKKHDGMYSPTVVADDFEDYFYVYPLFIKYSRST